MLRKCRTIFILVSLLLCTFLLTSCGNDAGEDVQIISKDSPKPKATDAENQTYTIAGDSDTNQPDDEDDGEDSYRNVLESQKQLPIYCINDDGTDIESVDILIDDKADINAALVIDEVVAEFSNHELTIGISNVKQDDKGSVFVSFQKETAPVAGVEEDMEYLILDSFSQSILDNVEDCKAVIFQVEGNAYQSKHISFKENEAYDWK